jgi:hypothetical protein
MGQTLRTVAVLVGACILFVGVLSVVAVTITNRALGGPKRDALEPAAADAADLPRRSLSPSSHGRPQSI